MLSFFDIDIYIKKLHMTCYAQFFDIDIDIKKMAYDMLCLVF